MEVTGRKEKKSILYCEPCEVECSITSANGACRECKEYMCTTCFRHHLKSKHTRNHVLLSLEEFSNLSLGSVSEDVTRCEKHKNEIIKFYCRSHVAIGCGDCIVLDQTTCKPEYINDLSKTFKEGNIYKTIAKRVEDIERKITTHEHELGKSRDEVEKMNEKALKEIRELRKEINKCLDEGEAKILSEIKKLREENTKTRKNLEKCFYSLTSELVKMKQMLNIKFHRGDALFINAVNCKSSLDDIETMFENTTKENALKGFKFVRNEHMTWLLKLKDPLGRLKINARRIPHQRDIKQKQKHFGVGVRVRRSPDCKRSNQDGGRPGKIIGFNQSGWAIVKWDNGYMDSYRIGQEDSQDLEII